MSIDPRALGLDLDISIANDDLTKAPQGGLSTVKNADNVAQALLLRLYTMPGELILHPDFGNPAYELISEPIVPSWHDRMRQAVLLAVEDEPRSDVLGVDIQVVAHEYRCRVTVTWRLVEENDVERNLIWEFALDAAIASNQAAV